jgi:phosphoribosylformimino-5-aminoimidazole carboxamide ribotide isomerase
MFRPCIDLHEGKVKQIVGGTLGNEARGLCTNFVSDRPASWFAELYKRDDLSGGHVIMLGPGNEQQARGALGAYPGGLQLGGGVSVENAQGWLDSGASHVIVTSWVFHAGKVDIERLKSLVQKIGREHLVLDLSCRLRGDDYLIVTDRWQRFTEVMIDKNTLEHLAAWCSEFLVHAVDVEGLCSGVDEKLVGLLAQYSPIPCTYAGGAKSIADLARVTKLSNGRVDLTIGSALDIFGGTGARYDEAVSFNRKQRSLSEKAAG